MDILSNIVGEAITLGGIITYTYVLFSLGAEELIKEYKSEINEKSLRSISLVVMISLIVFLIMGKVNKKSTDTDYFLIIGIVCVAIIGLVFFIFKINIVGKLNSKEAYEPKPTWCTLVVWSIVIIVLSGSIFVAYNSIYIEDLFNGQINIFEVGMIVFFYSVLVLSIGYMVLIVNLFNLKLYVIRSDEFRDGRVVCYIVSESESEFIIKCYNSYTIIISKEQVNGYIKIPNDVKIESSEKEEIIEKLFDKEYSGYWIEKNK